MSSNRTRDSDDTVVYRNHSIFRSVKFDGTTMDSGTNRTVPGPSNLRIIRHMEDTVTPDFKVRLARGEIINNDLYSTKLVCQDEGCDVDIEYRIHPSWRLPYIRYQRMTGSFEIYGLLYYGLGWTGSQLGESALPLDTGEAALSLTRAHANVGSSPTQALVTAAELNKNVKTLTKVYLGSKQLLLSSMLLLQKRFTRNFLRPRQLAEKYLAYRYGLRPMYYDVMNILQSIEELGKKSRTRFLGHEETVNSSSEELQAHAIGPNVGLDGLIEPDSNWSWSGQTGAVGYYHVTKSVINTVSATSGVLTQPRVETNTLSDVLGTGELLQSAWELVPFSFIVDWFLNVGDTIAAWAPKGNQSELCSWTTVNRKSVTVYEVHDWHNSQTIDTWWSSYDEETVYKCTGRYIVTNEVTERTADPQLVAIPSWDVRLNVAKLADLMAILYKFK